MAFDGRTTAPMNTFGPIEALTLSVLREELMKLQGTLSEDNMMDYEKCLVICSDFIDELGVCINLSMEKYPEDKDVHNRVFDGLQDIIDLMHGRKAGLNDFNGYPRLMDHQESRMSAADRLGEITEELAFEVSQRETTREKARMAQSEPVRAQSEPIKPKLRPKE